MAPAYCLMLIFVALQLRPVLTAADTTDIVDKATEVSNDIGGTTVAPSLPPLAEKLVRYRRQPPVTIVKHIVRSSKRTKPRRRYKRPKIKYGPPNYSYGEPLTYYKPRLPSPPSVVAPTFSIEDFQSLNLDAHDFELPPSSYEAQAMDLDFYSHGDNAFDVPKAPGPEYSFDLEPESPSYSSYKPSKAVEPESQSPRLPHQAYGVPKEYKYSGGFKSKGKSHTQYGGSSFEPSQPHYGSGGSLQYLPEDNSYTGHVDNSYETPSTSYGSDNHNSFAAPPAASAHTPASQYEVPAPQTPDAYPPAHGQGDYQSSFSVYDKKIPNSGYGGSFGQSSYGSGGSISPNFEITPSYEINVPNNPDTSYQPPPANSHPGNFAEPPDNAPSSYQAPEVAYRPPQPTPPQSLPHPSEEVFLPPSQELPLNPNHKQPAYDFPKSSYEVPLYDPIPFDASNTEEQETYPPHPYDVATSQELDEQRDPTSHLEPAREENNFVSQYQSNQIPSSGGHVDEYGPFTPTRPAPSVEPTMRPRRTRKRKRVRGGGGGGGTSLATTKHILDAPELEEAFEAGNHNSYRQSSSDAVGNESNTVEAKRSYGRITSFVTPTLTLGNDNYASQAWNPMRIQTSSRMVFAPTTPAKPFEPLAAAAPTIRPRPQPQPQPQPQQQRPQSPRAQTRKPPPFATAAKVTPAHNDSASSAAVLIEKSRSHSFYDGTIAPPTPTPTLTVSNTYRSRPNRFRMPTRPTPTQSTSEKAPAPPPPKRTTKSVYETTLFKSPRFDKNVSRKLNMRGQTLPRNHKLF